MSIRPVAFQPDGSIDVWHDEANHGGTIAAGTLTLANFPLAAGAVTPDYRFLTLHCPAAGCASVSVHPITGGADQPRVQALFLAVATANGCPCGALPAGKPVALIRSHLRAHAQQLGGNFIA